MNIESKMTQKSLKQLESMTGEKITLGGFLRAIRQGEGMTQIDFAKKLGMSKQHLCDIEHHRKIVSLKLAAHYAQELGYSQAQFVRLALQGMVDREGLPVIVDVSQVA
jgi:transcriptional regulator with XRE-family HTH domain